MPSLSSASTTSHSPSPNAALLPTSLTSPPITKLGDQPARRRIEREHRRARGLAVRTRDRDRLARRGQRGERGRAVQHRDAALGRGDELDVPQRDRGRVHDRVGVGGHVLGPVADVHVDARRREPLEHGRALDVGAADRVAHAREHRARSRSSPRRRRRRCARGAGGERSSARRAASRQAARACSSTRSASRSAASGRPSPRRGAHLLEPIGRAEQLRHDRGRAARDRTRRRAASPPRPRARASARCASGGRSARPGSGTSTAGSPTAVSSAIVPAPDAAHRERGAAVERRPCAPRSRRARTRSASPAPPGGRELGRARVEVARPAHVVHREVGAGAPAVVAAERGPVDRARALRAAEDRDERGIVGRVRALEPRERGAHRVAGERGVRERRARQRHRRARAEPHAEPVREPGRGVLFVHDDRDPQQPRREHARERRVAAEADDDARPVAGARSRSRARRPSTRPRSRRRSASVSRRCSPRPGSRSISKPGRGHDPALDAALAADEPHRVAAPLAAPGRRRSPGYV